MYRLVYDTERMKKHSNCIKSISYNVINRGYETDVFHRVQFSTL